MNYKVQISKNVENYISVPQPSFSPLGRPESAIISERLAIVACGLVVGLLTLPLLVLVELLSSLYWGTTSIYQLLSGEPEAALKDIEA